MIYVQTIDHSLGALLAQTNELGHDQAICHLSRTMVGVEYIGRKRVLSLSVHLQNETLPNGLNNSYNFLGKSPKITYNQIWVTQLQVSQLVDFFIII